MAHSGLVGRDAELDALRSGLATARAGGTAMIVVRGGLGTGKTALLDACAAAADLPVRRVVRAEHDRAPAIAELLPDAPDRPGVPPSQRFRAHVADLTAAAPLVLLVDDAQWCDPGSVETLDLLVRRGQRLLVVAAVRATGHGAGGWGVVAPRCNPLTLRPFTADEVAVLVRRGWRTPPEPGFTAACARASGGNPLALRMIIDRLAGLPPTAAQAPAVAAAGTAVLAELLPRRIGPNPGEARTVAEAVAVLGRVNPESVAMLAGVSRSVVDEVFETLCAEGVLGAADIGELRRALLDDLPPGRRRWWHARAARLLADAGRPPTEIAPHLLELPASEPWMRSTLRAAARDTADRGRAGRYLDHVLVAAPADPRTLVEYARAVGDADPLTAHRMLSTGLDRTTAPRDRAVLAVELAFLTPAAAAAPSALAALDDAVAHLDAAIGPRPTGADRDLRVRASAARLAAGWTRPPIAADGPVPAGDTPAERELLALRAFTDMLAARPAAPCAEHARTALAEPGPIGWPHAAAAYALAVAGDVPAALAGLDRVLVGTRPSGWTRALAGMLRALVLADAGDAGAAVADAECAVEALGSVDTARVALATALHRAGDLDAAVRALPETGPDVPVLGRPLALLVRAAAAERADPAAALGHLLSCEGLLAELGVANPVVAPWWVDATRLLAESGKPRAAADLAERAARWSTPTGAGLALLARGFAASAADTPPPVDALADAVTVLTGASADWWLTRAEVALAEAHLRADDRVSARRSFRAAAERATRCGYRALADAARTRLVAAGGRRHGAPDARDILTTAERRVAELAAAGATNREISERLLITLRTVETHLTSLYRKLSVPGRAALPDAVAEQDRA
ncbi:AAA family ATPase [Actinokineospora guangxiensis]|uniref:AAA family ATPase n=1 Tax=Actinokineospora guangxiensis TaxID=1490288 RepID=A0ABW0EVI3_9PSEU